MNFANKQGRVAWIDAIKMFAMFCVVFGHCCSVLSNELPAYKYVNLFIVSFNMPLFVFITGFTSYNTLSKLDTWNDLFNYICKISERIALPNVCFSCLIGFFNHIFIKWEPDRAIFNGSIILFFISWYYIKSKKESLHFYHRYIILLPFLLNIFSKCSYFWFLEMLLYVYLAISLAIVILKRFKLSIAFLSLPLSVIIMLMAPSDLHGMDLIIYFIFGIIMYKINIMGCFLNFKPWVNLITILILIVISILLFENYNTLNNDFYHNGIINLFINNQYVILFSRVLGSVCLIISLCISFQLIVKEYNVLAFCGTKTLGLYMIHSQFIHILRSNVFIDNINVYIWIIGILISIIITFMSLLIIRLLERYFICRKLLLGEK